MSHFSANLERSEGPSPWIVALPIIVTGWERLLSISAILAWSSSSSSSFRRSRYERVVCVLAGYESVLAGSAALVVLVIITVKVMCEG